LHYFLSFGIQPGFFIFIFIFTFQRFFHLTPLALLSSDMSHFFPRLSVDYGCFPFITPCIKSYA
jgi:hypothetical protein